MGRATSGSLANVSRAGQVLAKTPRALRYPTSICTLRWTLSLDCLLGSSTLYLEFGIDPLIGRGRLQQPRAVGPLEARLCVACAKEAVTELELKYQPISGLQGPALMESAGVGRKYSSPRAGYLDDIFFGVVCLNVG